MPSQETEQVLLRAEAPMLRLKGHRSNSIHLQFEDLVGCNARNFTQATLSVNLPKLLVD